MALPEIAMGKPKVVQGFGMLSKLVFGRDGEGNLFFNSDGVVPDTVPADKVTTAMCSPDEKK
jgi:hypothetical protein